MLVLTSNDRVTTGNWERENFIARFSLLLALNECFRQCTVTININLPALASVSC